MNKAPTNLEPNRAKIADILAEHPETTHINFRRDDDELVDIPLGQADFIARQYPMWRVIDGGIPSVDVTVARGEELPVVLPPKPSEEAAATEMTAFGAASSADAENLPPVAVAPAATPATTEPPAPAAEPPKATRTARKRTTRR